MYKILYSKFAQKDSIKLNNSNLKEKALKILEILRVNPYQNPPPYEKLIGDLQGCYSRRVNIQHRIVYEIIEVAKIVRVLRMWTHYE